MQNTRSQRRSTHFRIRGRFRPCRGRGPSQGRIRLGGQIPWRRHHHRRCRGIESPTVDGNRRRLHRPKDRPLGSSSRRIPPIHPRSSKHRTRRYLSQLHRPAHSSHILHPNALPHLKITLHPPPILPRSRNPSTHSLPLRLHQILLPPPLPIPLHRAPTHLLLPHHPLHRPRRLPRLRSRRRAHPRIQPKQNRSHIPRRRPTVHPSHRRPTQNRLHPITHETRAYPLLALSDIHRMACESQISILVALAIAALQISIVNAFHLGCRLPLAFAPPTPFQIDDVNLVALFTKIPPCDVAVYVPSSMYPSQCGLHLVAQRRRDHTVLRDGLTNGFQSEYMQDPPHLVVPVQSRDHVALEIPQNSIHLGFVL